MMSPEIVLSPSQIETWLLCPRKWGWDKLEGKPRKQHPSATVGLRVHKILELYLRDGVAPDRYETLSVGGHTYYPGRIAIKMAEHLPPAGSCSQEEIEQHFTTEIDGIKFQGYKDLRKTGKVYDHKSTSNLQYAKTPEDLRVDPQALIYAWDELDVTMEPIGCQWTYGQTKGKERAKAVKVSLSPEEICKGLEEIVLPAARQIIDARTRKPPVKELAYNVRACDKYGGCPYVRDCNLTGRERIRGIMNREELIARLHAKRGAKVAPETASEPESKPEQDKPESSALAKLKAKQAAAKAASDPAPDKEKVARATGINPKGEAQAAPDPEPESKPTSQKVVKTFSLFVDCEPINWPGKTVRIEDLLGPAADQVCEDLGVLHYRLTEFGKGPGCLSAQLKDNLTSNPLPEGTALLMSLRTNEGRDVYQGLYELAKEVTVSR